MSFTIITVTDANAARADSGAGCKGYLCTDPKKEEEKKWLTRSSNKIWT